MTPLEAVRARYPDLNWILEPEAKNLFREAGLPVPRYRWARTAR